MNEPSFRFRAIAVGLGLMLTVVVAPLTAGATDMSGMRPMMTGGSTTPTVQVNVAALDSRVLARVAALRQNLMGR
ncbi:MAG TPA: hypothetical protein VFI22_10805 [Thermomicrobiales bacterium]|nr:hypothetical protein [Thermomicrobiales bacterium]